MRAGLVPVSLLAIARMQTEAEQLHADGIVAVPLKNLAQARGAQATEFFAIGTAVRTIRPDHDDGHGSAISEGELTMESYYSAPGRGGVPGVGGAVASEPYPASPRSGA
jgi:hypothetical protein